MHAKTDAVKRRFDNRVGIEMLVSGARQDLRSPANNLIPLANMATCGGDVYFSSGIGLSSLTNLAPSMNRHEVGPMLRWNT